MKKKMIECPCCSQSSSYEAWYFKGNDDFYPCPKCRNVCIPDEIESQFEGNEGVRDTSIHALASSYVTIMDKSMKFFRQQGNAVLLREMERGHSKALFTAKAGKIMVPFFPVSRMVVDSGEGYVYVPLKEISIELFLTTQLYSKNRKKKFIKVLKALEAKVTPSRYYTLLHFFGETILQRGEEWVKIEKIHDHDIRYMQNIAPLKEELKKAEEWRANLERQLFRADFIIGCAKDNLNNARLQYKAEKKGELIHE